MRSANPSPMTRWPNANTFESLCCLVTSAVKTSCTSAQRTPFTLLEAIDIPMPVPQIKIPVSENVANGKFDKGILICGTGIGMSIASNKVKGVRCAFVHDVFTAEVTRQHNDSNVLALGQRVIGEGLALLIVKTWLTSEFEGGRHQKRIDKIEGDCS